MEIPRFGLGESILDRIADPGRLFGQRTLVDLIRDFFNLLCVQQIV